MGLRGDNLLGWHWDLSSTFGGDSDNLGLYDTANTGLYAATGSTPTSVKVGHWRYDVNRWLALRGTVSNGFRAPTLAQEHFVSIIASPTYANAQLAVDSPGAKALGASPLRPEKSTNYSAGVVLNPLPIRSSKTLFT